MTRENFNRYDNDQKHGKKKQEKRIKNPISKGSIRNQDKKKLKWAIEHYEDTGEYYED
jgi:hypothetical protein